MKRILLVLLVLLGLQTQAQISPCDSISYTITTSPNSNLLQLNGVISGICPVNFPCVVSDWDWQVCDDALCFADTGQTTIWNQFTTNDTLKVCLTTILNINGVTYSCMQCDSLVFGGNGWMLMNMGNPLAIKEIKNNLILDNRMYDLLGREIFEIQLGQMYIKNNKKCITIK
jgi:hypothetical protein